MIRKASASLENKINKEENIENDIENKLISFYKAKRKKVQKTIYSKNPDGKYITLDDAKIYEEYGKGEPLILLEG